ncbi:MAG: nuclear transport factor 2 family protein [Burkholderiales bacterium]
MTPHPHAALITRFYTAFAQRDWAVMASCYHPDVHFTDPAFDLRGPRAAQMWRMLCTQGKDLQLSFSDVQANDASGSAHWEARYTFSKTGRSVHNQIDAQFQFRDGLIHRHVDHFDFWRWSRQALGRPGVLLGWSGFLKGKVQEQAARSLDSFVTKLG